MHVVLANRSWTLPEVCFRSLYMRMSHAYQLIGDDVLGLGGNPYRLTYARGSDYRLVWAMDRYYLPRYGIRFLPAPKVGILMS